MNKYKSAIIAVEHLTMNGIYQAPARPDEDRRDNFSYGGWSAEGDDPVMQDVIGKQMSKGWSLLSGRTTYEGLYEGWRVRQPEHPMAKALATVQKFVCTRNNVYRLPWENSILLHGDAAAEVRNLKQIHDKPLIVFGSGQLLATLFQHNLVDQMILMVHPLVLGTGRIFFKAGSPEQRWKVVDHVMTGKGVLVTTYKNPSV